MEKERKKAEKQAKFDQKKAAAAKSVPAGPSKNKEKKAAAASDKVVLPPYVEDTKPGDKKSKPMLLHLFASLNLLFSHKAFRRSSVQCIQSHCGRISLVLMVGEGEIF